MTAVPLGRRGGGTLGTRERADEYSELIWPDMSYTYLKKKPKVKSFAETPRTGGTSHRSSSHFDSFSSNSKLGTFKV